MTFPTYKIKGGPTTSNIEVLDPHGNSVNNITRIQIDMNPEDLVRATLTLQVFVETDLEAQEAYVEVKS